LQPAAPRKDIPDRPENPGCVSLGDESPEERPADAASQISKGGTAVSNVALRVAIPAA
jgi:hypothetical protein